MTRAAMAAAVPALIWAGVTIGGSLIAAPAKFGAPPSPRVRPRKLTSGAGYRTIGNVEVPRVTRRLLMDLGGPAAGRVGARHLRNTSYEGGDPVEDQCSGSAEVASS